MKAKEETITILIENCVSKILWAIWMHFYLFYAHSSEKELQNIKNTWHYLILHREGSKVTKTPF